MQAWPRFAIDSLCTRKISLMRSPFLLEMLQSDRSFKKFKTYTLCLITQWLPLNVWFPRSKKFKVTRVWRVWNFLFSRILHFPWCFFPTQWRFEFSMYTSVWQALQIMIPLSWNWRWFSPPSISLFFNSFSNRIDVRSVFLAFILFVKPSGFLDDFGFYILSIFIAL